MFIFTLPGSLLLVEALLRSVNEDFLFLICWGLFDLCGSFHFLPWKPRIPQNESSIMFFAIGNSDCFRNKLLLEIGIGFRGNCTCRLLGY